MKQNKWLEFLFTLVVRLIGGALFGVINWFFFYQGILESFAANDLQTPKVLLFVSMIGCAIIAVATTPRWQTPWRHCRGWNVDVPIVSGDRARLIVSGGIGLLLVFWIRKVLTAEIIRSAVKPISFMSLTEKDFWRWGMIVVSVALAGICFRNVVESVRVLYEERNSD